MPYSHPHYGGLAIWVYSLIKRVDKAKEAMDGLYFIPEHKDHREAMERLAKLKNQLDQYIMKTLFNEWQDNMGQHKNQEKIDECMTNSILMRVEIEVAAATNQLEGEQEEQNQVATNDKRSKAGRKRTKLKSNFDVKLLQVLLEMQGWQKISTMGLNFPLSLSKLLARKEPLRVLRESVMLIVRDYNNIIDMVNKREANLFSEHLDMLDGAVNAGVRKYQWLSNADAFVIMARNECALVAAKIRKFQSRYAKITD